MRLRTKAVAMGMEERKTLNDSLETGFWDEGDRSVSKDSEVSGLRNPVGSDVFYRDRER